MKLSVLQPTAPADVIVLRCALAIPTLIAMCLNGAHAVHTWTRAYPLLVTVSLWVLIPPLLPAAVHLVAVIGRSARSATRLARGAAMAGALAVGAGAFAVSLLMQRDMITDMGVPDPIIGWIAPLLFDALAAMATVGLFMVNHSGEQQAVVRTADPLLLDVQGNNGQQQAAANPVVAPTVQPQLVASADVPAGGGPVADHGAATEPAADMTTDIDMRPETASDVDASNSTVVARPEEGNNAAPAAVADAAADAAEQRRAVAQAVVEARSLKASVDSVVAVLAALDAGMSQSAAAREAGVDRSTVRKVIDTVEVSQVDEDARALSLVG